MYWIKEKGGKKARKLVNSAKEPEREREPRERHRIAKPQKPSELIVRCSAEGRLTFSSRHGE